ncbi:acetyl-CoA hydrolase/transferase C-terminal domain-containing protein [Microbulbifer sp. TYP-18]|uniref:acetyl-CoA hydrolase/transferase C-terminal domain-containing protein n=1 Tax=Microbulbifer sp. TYP-18 TaxID=3230024 RepID=UPI0034C68DAA
MDRQPLRLNSATAAVDAVLEKLGKRIVLGLPLGLGKANHFANALYARAAEDPSISLTIFTALTLERPSGTGEIGRRFTQPLLDRLYNQYQELAYTQPRHRGKLPPNIQVCEFFLLTGAFLHNAEAQQSHVCANYTLVVRDLLDRGVNVIAQMVSPGAGGDTFSLSCNPDLTLPLLRETRQIPDYQLLVLGESNPQLPYLAGDSELPATEFDLILEGEQFDTPPFPVPSLPVSLTDYAIALQISTLIADGGSLEIGIGTLGDAICHVLGIRQTDNDTYRRLFAAVNADDSLMLRQRFPPQLESFVRGLYGVSEMVPQGFLALRRNRILKREVFADAALQKLLDEEKITTRVTEDTLLALRDCGRIQAPLTVEDTEFLQRLGIVDPSYSWRGHKLLTAEGEEEECDLHSEHGRRRLLGRCANEKLRGGVWLHGGFYLGPASMYAELRDMAPAERAGICMTAIDFINDLQRDRALKVAQRRQARFVNSAMMVTLNGAAVSDGLADSQVVSGVGGQYNFVAQAQELQDGRSILALASTRESRGKVTSNIVWQYPHTTIPRHLRDIVVTEYGVADLRGKTDRDVMVAMLCIADSRFQPELLQRAKAAGKVERDFVIPLEFSANRPDRITAAFDEPQYLGLLPYFPLGTDFSEEEAMLAVALKQLKAVGNRWWKMLPLILDGRRVRRDHSEKNQPIHRCLERMDFEYTDTFEHRLLAYVVAGALYRYIDRERPLCGS